MATTPITPVSVIPAANTWTALGTTPGISRVQSCDVRVANIHASADANAKIRVNNGSTIVERGGILPVPFGTSDSIVDLEKKFVLPHTWFFEVWASAGSNLEFSLSGWEADV